MKRETCHAETTLIAHLRYIFDINININSNMILRLSGHFSKFRLAFFALKSPLGIARQWSREKIAIFVPKASESY